VGEAHLLDERGGFVAHRGSNCPATVDYAELSKRVAPHADGLGRHLDVLANGERSEELHPLECPTKAEPGARRRVEVRHVGALDHDRARVRSLEAATDV